MKTLPGILVESVPVKIRDVEGKGQRLTPFDQSMPDGAFAIGWHAPVHMLEAVCPCGCREAFLIPVQGPNDPPPAGSPAWTWDGNREAPTLSPSIFRTGTCGWHGFLRAGVWEFCG